MASPKFTFYELSDSALNEMGLDPVPFPARSRRAKEMFGGSSVDLQKLLTELEEYLSKNPEHSELYRHNIESLSMICATNQIHDNDAKGALVSLGYGLRANPNNTSLQLHQALALQINGYHKLAAYEYEALLNVMPYAFDPVVRSLAAKAYAAIDQKEDGLRVLEGLAEDAFKDEGLQKLRMFLQEDTNDDPPEIESTEIAETLAQSAEAEKSLEIFACHDCGAENDVESKFCTSCGKSLQKLDSQKTVFCGQCGIELSPSKKFCTDCGAVRL